ncbi:MAG: polyprenyl synthetase family protein [Candidatus Dadabacteria bacterium]|nr:polyprenyl synthetase family protein [Candidatus Dadabacteria bacterium]
MEFNIKSYLASKRELVDRKLDSLLKYSPKNTSPLEESIRYSALSGGKRLRPILMIASNEAFGGKEEMVLPIACAVEMIHTYSLIHDDLPCMDDDSLRRGIATNHNVYGEAVAVLAGDALLTDAFNIMVREGLSSGLRPKILTEIIGDISHAAGSKGMIKGQSIDLTLDGTKLVLEGTKLTLEGTKDVSVGQVEKMHSLKTGALIEVSVTVGAKIGGANDKQIKKLVTYAKALGLAFQIVDDILDIEGGKSIGKEVGADARNKKTTYPELVGLKRSKRKAQELTKKAFKALKDFDDKATPLREIALYLADRNF